MGLPHTTPRSTSTGLVQGTRSCRSPRCQSTGPCPSQVRSLSLQARRSRAWRTLPRRSPTPSSGSRSHETECGTRCRYDSRWKPCVGSPTDHYSRYGAWEYYTFLQLSGDLDRLQQPQVRWDHTDDDWPFDSHHRSVEDHPRSHIAIASQQRG